MFGGDDETNLSCSWFSSSRYFCVHRPAVLLLAATVVVLPGGSDPDRAEDDQTECEGSNEECPSSPGARWLGGLTSQEHGCANGDDEEFEHGREHVEKACGFGDSRFGTDRHTCRARDEPHARDRGIADEADR